MQIRDRVRELRRVRAADLKPNPKNWRLHPAAQADALRGVLAELGYASALVARELDDGSLELIDGHLRAETTPDALVPVLIVDLSRAEADKLLAVHDPLAAMAGRDQTLLNALLAEVETDNEALQALLTDLATEQQAIADEPGMPAEVDVPQVCQVLVECRDETEQQTLFERLTAEGWRCKLMLL